MKESHKCTFCGGPMVRGPKMRTNREQWFQVWVCLKCHGKRVKK